jgi:hypothetical protein
MSQPLILIATPCFGGMVSQNYMLSVIRLMSYAKSAAFDVSLSMLGYDALISRARSTLVAAFLDNPAATHLLFVDADISFKPQQVERLLRFDKDFTGALYPLKSIDWNSSRNAVSSAAKAYNRLPCPMSEAFAPKRSASRKAILSREFMPAAVFS